jgi:hypothetical protein
MKHTNALCGQDAWFITLKQVVHIITTGLYRPNTYDRLVTVKYYIIVHYHPHHHHHHHHHHHQDYYYYSDAWVNQIVYGFLAI